MIWEQSRSTQLCGSNREHVIKVGDPVLSVTSHRLLRCVACAKRIYGAEPPPSWPVEATVQSAPTSQPWSTPSGFASTFRDGKLAQLPKGDR